MTSWGIGDDADTASPVLGLLAGAVGIALTGRLLKRARREINTVVRRGEWLTASALAFSHGANDAQKTTGVVALLLLTTGHHSAFTVPIWVRLMAAASLTIGTTFGGWRIVRTLGSGVFRMAPLDGLVSLGGSAAVILAGACRRLQCGRRRNSTTRPPCALVGGARDRGRMVDRAADLCRGGRRGLSSVEGNHMKFPRAWFLPEAHDVLGTLTAQLDVVETILGLLRAWCAGTGGEKAVAQLRSRLGTEHDTRRRLQTQVRERIEWCPMMCAHSLTSQGAALC